MCDSWSFSTPVSWYSRRGDFNETYLVVTEMVKCLWHKMGAMWPVKYASVCASLAVREFSLPGQPVEFRKEAGASGSDNKPFRFKSVTRTAGASLGLPLWSHCKKREHYVAKKNQLIPKENVSVILSLHHRTVSSTHIVTWTEILTTSAYVCKCVCASVCFPSSQCLASPEHYRVVRLPFSLKPPCIQEITQVSAVSDRSFH